MKPHKIVLLATLAVVVSFSGCKKGPGDPFISLHSRKARVVGEWVIDKMVQDVMFNGTTIKDGETTSVTENRKVEVIGTSLVINFTGTETSPAGTFTYTTSGTGSAEATVTINKNGTFERSVAYTSIIMNLSENGATETQTGSLSIVESGTWNFLGDVEEAFKDKERIVLNILTKTTTIHTTHPNGDFEEETIINSYGNGANSEIWHLQTLRKKELVMEAELSSTGMGNYSFSYFGLTGTSTESYTEIGTLTATLVQG